MSEHAPQQLRFPPISGFSVRGDFQGGALSSDFGPMLLRGVDQQIGLIEPTFRTSFSRFRNIALHSALPATSAKPHGIGSNSGQARILVQ